MGLFKKIGGAVGGAFKNYTNFIGNTASKVWGTPASRASSWKRNKGKIIAGTAVAAGIALTATGVGATVGAPLIAGAKGLLAKGAASMALSGGVKGLLKKSGSKIALNTGNKLISQAMPSQNLGEAAKELVFQDLAKSNTTDGGLLNKMTFKAVTDGVIKKDKIIETLINKAIPVNNETVKLVTEGIRHNAGLLSGKNEVPNLPTNMNTDEALKSKLFDGSRKDRKAEERTKEMFNDLLVWAKNNWKLILFPVAIIGLIGYIFFNKSKRKKW
jgi:hypothetical protein